MQSIQDLLAIFASGREVATDLAEDLGTLGRTEAARHFLFYFQQADIIFCPIVVKWNLKIIEKPIPLVYAA